MSKQSILISELGIVDDFIHLFIAALVKRAGGEVAFTEAELIAAMDEPAEFEAENGVVTLRTVTTPKGPA